jgi:capsid assembly protease
MESAMFDLQSLHNSLWLAEPNRLRLAVAQLAGMPAWPTAREVAKARKKRLELARQAAAGAIRAASGKVGLIAVHGPIEQRLSCAGLALDGCSTEEVSAALDALMADKSVGAVVLHVDSPGGSSYGVGELSDKIFAARDKKPTYAIADSTACSAAYWIASSAGTFCCTPGGDVGSVGVYAMHVDQSKALDAGGIAVSFIHAGKYKVEGNPYEQLSPDARAYIQSWVDYTYKQFTQGLKRNRGVSLEDVRSNFGQGRVLNPDDALEAKMIDRIMSFEDLLTKLTGGGNAAGVKSASVEMLRLRQAQRLRAADPRLRFGLVSTPTRSASEAAAPRRAGPGLTHDSKTSDKEPTWSDVDKTKLPRVAFAGQGDADKKSTWSYPHHWVEGGGQPDDNGVFTTGTLWLHREGLNAAWSAAQGGRSGQKASQDVIDHLQKHRKAMGLE